MIFAPLLGCLAGHIARNWQSLPVAELLLVDINRKSMNSFAFHSFSLRYHGGRLYADNATSKWDDSNKERNKWYMNFFPAGFQMLPDMTLIPTGTRLNSFSPNPRDVGLYF